MDIAAIQRALLARGYDLGRAGADGDAGPKTIAAVTAFQRAAGLVADGIAGPLTVKALEALDVSTVKAPIDMPPWLALAIGELGVKEGRGALNNPRVVQYFADSGFPGIKTDSTAYCAAGVGAMLKRAGFTPSGSLAARSYESWGVGLPLTRPVLGCVATKKRAGSAWMGHVGFVVGASKDQVFLLGFNQNDEVNISAFKRSEITAFRWPSSVAIPAEPNLPTTIAGAKSGVREA